MKAKITIEIDLPELELPGHLKQEPKINIELDKINPFDAAIMLTTCASQILTGVKNASIQQST